jgi:glutathionylspermidine synthase
MYPNHPNLLPSYFDNPKNELGAENFKAIGVSGWVSKPLFGREGAGIFISNNFTSFDNFVDTTENNYGRDPKTQEQLGKSIYQAYWKLPTV